MSEAASRQQWNHTASVMALLANLHRDSKRRRPFAPADFHPHTERPVALPLTELSLLKAVFVDRQSITTPPRKSS